MMKKFERELLARCVRLQGKLSTIRRHRLRLQALDQAIEADLFDLTRLLGHVPRAKARTKRKARQRAPGKA